MPLVPLNVVKTWYRKESLVYKNFAYLFQNQLWCKTIPNGFSLCPYFWLSLFSLFIVRPFIGLVLLCRAVVDRLGLIKLINFSDKYCSKLAVARPFKDTYIMPSLIAVIMLALLLMFVVGIINTVSAMLAGGVFWILFCAGAPAVAYIASEIANEYTECDTSWYARLVLLISAVSALCIWPAYAAIVFLAIASACVSVSWWILTGVYDMTIWTLKSLLGSLTNPGAYAGFIAFAGAAIAGYIYTLFAPKKSETKTSVLEEINYSLLAHYVYAFDYWFYLSQPEILKILKENYELTVELNNIHKAQTDCDAVFVKFSEFYKPIHDAKSEKRKAALERGKARAETCKRWTNAVKEFLHPALVFGCLIWELIKSKKQGACPYLKFEDTAVETAEPPKPKRKYTRKKE